MKTVTKEFPRNDIYPIEKITAGYTPVLFDIETTGLKAETSHLYLIGVTEIRKDRLLFHQWFAERPSDELEVLSSFLSWLPDRTCLIHFNGRGFDIPYLEKKCREFKVRSMLSQLPNVDLYRSFAPLKDYFGMTSRRLVAYEKLIGLEREDSYNGGELIEVYQSYIGKSKFDPEEAEKLLKLLLLHNEEDIKDMVPVLGLFTYMDLLTGNFTEYSLNASGTDYFTIMLKFRHNFPLDYAKSLATLPSIGPINIKTSGISAEIQIPLINTRLKHFFDDYKNYYYLPAEDVAIHKSVAASVDSSHRIPATKATAYTYAKGDFIPQTGESIKPNYKFELTDKVSFLPVKTLCTDEAVKLYIKSLF